MYLYQTPQVTQTVKMGDAVFGSLGYALMDAQYANKVVLLTDSIVDYPNTSASIKQDQVDYVVKVYKVGDPDKIGSDATRFTKDPKDPKELKMTSATTAP